MNATTTAPSASHRPWRWILLGGIALGTLDILFAWAFWVPQGVPPLRIFQSIAAGLYGEASFGMGATSAWVGALCHYFIATVMVWVYYAVSRFWPTLIRKPYAFGLPYGVALYLAMTMVVLPLSAAGPPSFKNTAWVVSSVVMHAVFGVICALFARRAART